MVLEVSDLVDRKFNICLGYPVIVMILEQKESCAILKLRHFLLTALIKQNYGKVGILCRHHSLA